jgi:hypothetical protein
MKKRQVAPSPKETATCQPYHGVILLARPKYKNIYQYKKETQKPPSKRYNPWRYVNKKENLEHQINFQTLHDGLIKQAIKQNQQMEADFGWKQTDYNKLYGTETIETEKRKMHIRWVNIPTFTEKNKPQYYTAFFVNIDYFRVTDFKQIQALCLQQIDHRQMEGIGRAGNRGRYTIFLSGKQLGRTSFKKWNLASKQHHVFFVNTITANGKKRSCVDVRHGIFKTLTHLFRDKLAGIKKRVEEGWHYYKGQKHKHRLYGQLKNDVFRLKSFLEQLRNIFFSYKKRFWRIKNFEEKNKDTKSKSSNNIRKQTNQYLKLLNSVKNSCEKSKKDHVANETRVCGV